MVSYFSNKNKTHCKQVQVHHFLNTKSTKQNIYLEIINKLNTQNVRDDQQL